MFDNVKIKDILFTSTKPFVCFFEMYNYVNLNRYANKFTKHIVFFLLGDSTTSEFYVPTFRNTLFQFNKLCEQDEFSLFTRPMKIKQTKCF